MLEIIEAYPRRRGPPGVDLHRPDRAVSNRPPVVGRPVGSVVEQTPLLQRREVSVERRAVDRESKGSDLGRNVERYLTHLGSVAPPLGDVEGRLEEGAVDRQGHRLQL